MQHRMMAQQQKQQEHAARQQQMLQQAKQRMLNRGLSGMRDGRALPNYASMNSSGYGGFYDQGVLGYSDGNGASKAGQMTRRTHLRIGLIRNSTAEGTRCRSRSYCGKEVGRLRPVSR